MAKYKVVFEDPDNLDQALAVITPDDAWLEEAMRGNLPPISVHWELQDDEQKAKDEGKHDNYQHDYSKWIKQFTAPRVGKLTEEEAMEYLVMKDVPRRVWSVEYNRPMFKIVKTEEVPTDRKFRDAWRLSQ